MVWFRRELLRGKKISIGQLRLISGLVLQAFLAMHLLNHALGLIGLDAMEAGRTVFLLIWRNPLGTILLYGATLMHVVLVLQAIVRRRGWRRLRRGEALQIFLGLLIPPLVIFHVLANRGLNLVSGLNDTYAWVLVGLWLAEPLEGLKQAILVLVAWGHGVLGLYYWLRLKPWFDRWSAWFFAIALLLPTLALAGFMSGGREVAVLYQDPIWLGRYEAIVHLPDAILRSRLNTATEQAYIAMIAVLMVTGLVAGWRRWQERRRGLITISYPNRQNVRVHRGVSILDASQQAGIAHASVCGGRGRCSTCRVRISAGREYLPVPDDAERQVLARIRAPDGVRLACQLRPTHNLSVTPLLQAAAVRDGHRSAVDTQGSERELCILFADLRDFTQFSEKKLPYDVVFVINEYFKAMGQAVERAGGQVDKFIGDGVMALFGLQVDAAEACRQALAAARAMSEALQQLNDSLHLDLPAPLRIGIGIHVGTVIVGEMGYAAVRNVTAIGDAVNTASRLEGMTKGFAVELIVSRRVAKRAGVDLKSFPSEEITIRGRSAPMPVYLIKNARALDARYK